MHRFAFILVLFVVLPHVLYCWSNDNDEQCQIKANITDDYITEMAGSGKGEASDDKPYYCYFLCTMEMGGPNSIFNDDGTVNESMIAAYFKNIRWKQIRTKNGYKLTKVERPGRKKFKQWKKKCSSITGQDFCDSIIRMFECIEDIESGKSSSAANRLRHPKSKIRQLLPNSSNDA